MKLKTFIDYYLTCPLCDGILDIDTDLSTSSTIDEVEDGLLLSLYKRDEVQQFKLLYTNKIQSDIPFILNTTYSIVRRQLQSIPQTAYDRLQLELACTLCNNFSYTSSNLTFDPVSKKISDIYVRSERVELSDNHRPFILSNDLKNNILTVYTNSSSQSISFNQSFKTISFDDIPDLILNIKKQLIVS